MFQLHWQESVSPESKLCDEPEFVGESRDVGHRLLVVDPLAVTYTIDHRGRAVYIVAASVFRTET
jgi:hypothetical protein